MKPKYWLVLGGAVGCAVQVAACSSEFSSCKESRTCAPSAGAGSAGDAGDSAEGRERAVAGASSSHAGAHAAAGMSAGRAPEESAGSAGEAPSTQCQEDADCSDHLACNGVETCEAGVCKPGTSPCANPEPDHCDATCKESNGAATCTIRGKDEDKDGHFSTACKASPGDDCDDSLDTVHPGAAELCDGIDNDCNSKADLADSLSAGGTTVAIGPASAIRSFPAIAWATDRSVYGIAYKDISTSSSSDLYFEEVDQRGAVKLAPKALNDKSAATAPTFGLALTWGGDQFGLAWTWRQNQNSPNDGGTDLRTVQSDGTASAALVIPRPANGAAFYYATNTSPSVARSSAGDWAILSTYDVQESDPVLIGNLVSGSNIIGSPKQLLAAANLDAMPSTVIRNGASFVVASALTNTVDGSLTTVKGLSLAYPIVASGTDGLAAAYRAPGASAPTAILYTAAGANKCGPVTFADSSFQPAAIVATPKGYLIVSSGAVKAQEINADCSLGAHFDIDAQANASNVHIAGSASGYGIVWQDATSNVPKLRLIGPRYCD